MPELQRSPFSLGIFPSTQHKPTTVYKGNPRLPHCSFKIKKTPPVFIPQCRIRRDTRKKKYVFHSNSLHTYKHSSLPAREEISSQTWWCDMIWPWHDIDNMIAHKNAMKFPQQKQPPQVNPKKNADACLSLIPYAICRSNANAGTWIVVIVWE